jgi:hypothetical protein
MDREARESNEASVMSALEQVLITEVSDAVEGVEFPLKAAVIVPILDIVHADQIESPQVESLQPFYTDEDLTEAFTAFQNDGAVPPGAMQVPLTTFAHSMMYERIENEDYDTAQTIEKTLCALSSAFQRTQVENQADVHERHLENRLLGVKKKQNTCDAIWEQRIADFKSSSARKLQLIQERHEIERKQFERECQSSEFLQRFTKPSSQLLQLWKLQKTLAQQHQFEEAKQVKKEAEDRQKQEAIEAEKRATQSIHQIYAKMVLRQNRELECAEACDTRKLKQMEIDMKRNKGMHGKESGHCQVRRSRDHFRSKHPTQETSPSMDGSGTNDLRSLSLSQFGNNMIKRCTIK